MRREPILDSAAVRLDPAPGELDPFRGRIRSMIKEGGSSVDDPPADNCPYFFVITPFGLDKKELLLSLLKENGFEVRMIKRIPDWGEVSAYLYCDCASDYKVEKAWAYRRFWRERYPDVLAEQWLLKGRGEYLRLREMKYELRRQLDSFGIPVSMPTFERPLMFHSFHLPDDERMGIEGRILKKVLTIMGVSSMREEPLRK